MSKYVTLQFQKLDPYTTAALVKDTTTGEKLWRHRITLITHNVYCSQAHTDYPVKKFTRLKDFINHLQDLPKEEKQLTLRRSSGSNYVYKKKKKK